MADWVRVSSVVAVTQEDHTENEDNYEEVMSSSEQVVLLLSVEGLAEAVLQLPRIKRFDAITFLKTAVEVTVGVNKVVSMKGVDYY